MQSYFDLSRSVDFSLTFRYVGALPYYRVAGYETGDARIAWRPVKHIEFAVTGRNLFSAPWSTAAIRARWSESNATFTGR